MKYSCLALILLGGLAVCCAVPSWITAQQNQPPPKELPLQEAGFVKSLRPLLKTYCFECHNANKRKGGLSLERFDSDAEALDATEVWDQVGERLRAREMPPAKAKQPTEEERHKLLTWTKLVAESRINCEQTDEGATCQGDCRLHHEPPAQSPRVQQHAARSARHRCARRRPASFRRRRRRRIRQHRRHPFHYAGAHGEVPRGR